MSALLHSDDTVSGLYWSTQADLTGKYERGATLIAHTTRHTPLTDLTSHSFGDKVEDNNADFFYHVHRIN